ASSQTPSLSLHDALPISAARLEEVWEQDQSDAAVAEGLAIAYLNGGDRKYRQGLETKAQHLLQETIRLGGMATFIVQHSHGKFAVFQGKSINDYCSGKLSIQPGRVVFIAQPRKGAQEHSFEAAAEALRIT